MRRGVRDDEYRLAAEFRIALRRFLAHSDETVRRSGLTPQRYSLLLTIRGFQNGRAELTMSELADALLLAQSSLSELVDRAEAAGLVERGGTADGRVVTVRLTPAGERQLEQAVRAVRGEREELLGHLDHARRRFDDALA